MSTVLPVQVSRGHVLEAWHLADVRRSCSRHHTMPLRIGLSWVNLNGFINGFQIIKTNSVLRLFQRSGHLLCVLETKTYANVRIKWVREKDQQLLIFLTLIVASSFKNGHLFFYCKFSQGKVNISLIYLPVKRRYAWFNLIRRLISVQCFETTWSVLLITWF